MSTFPVCDDVLDRSVELVSLPDAAKSLGVPVTRVHQLLREHRLLGVRRDRVVGVPAVFFDSDRGAGTRVVKQLPGAIALLRDGGYGDGDILRWLFTEDASLPGRPVDVLRGDHAREVLRRAQAMAF